MTDINNQEHSDINISVFSERLYKKRKEKKMSQARLAEAVSLSEASISNYETGNKKPTLQNIIELALALDVSTDYLCGITSESHYERYPALALYHAIKNCHLKVSAVSDDSVVLSFSDDPPSISAKELNNFFEEVKAIQTIKTACVKLSSGDELISQAEKNLLERFIELPGLPDYKRITNAKKNKKSKHHETKPTVD